MSGLPEPSRRDKVFTLAGTLLGLFLAALDQTIVATAGPVIQQDLHIEPALYVWITTAYLVASTVFVPIAGKLSDLYGRRWALLAGMIVFLAGSLLCGLSRNTAMLIVFRAVQGVGSAALFTTAFAVVADLFPPAVRGKYTGLFGAVFGISSIIGPLAGGFITDRFGWHWTFFINLPIGAIAIAFVAARMPALRREHAERPRIDVKGAIALAVAVVPLLVALTLGRGDTGDASGFAWGSWPMLVLFATSAIGIAAFVSIERRARDPILDLRMFGNRVFSAGNSGVFVLGMAFLAAVVFLPLFMVNVVGLSATDSGLTTTPLTLGVVVGNIVSGQLVSRFGRYKPLMLITIALLAIAFAVMGFGLSPHASQADVTRKMIFVGLALGPTVPLYTLAIQNGVAPQQIGAATSTATFFRQMGSTLGITIVGAVFASTLASQLHRELDAIAADVPAELRSRLLVGQGSSIGEGPSGTTLDVERVRACITEHYAEQRAQLDDASAIAALDREEQAALRGVDEVADAAKAAFTTAIERIYRVCIGFAALAFLITLRLPEIPLRRTLDGGPTPE
ncbi:MAG TPA: MDR family MFS transporter [Nannocystaceae bacterium]|nr:MDR family MFS transporter [Nannocystaceae bacterium]